MGGDDGQRPDSQGLYDPRTSTTPAASASSSTSRDARRTRIVAPGAAGPHQPGAPRRVRLRSQHRRRRRHPDPDAGRVPPQGSARSASRCRPPGEYGAGLVFLPHDRARRATRSKTLIERIVAEEGQHAARLARRADRRPADRRRARSRRSRCSSRSSSARRAPTPAPIERHARSSASCT